MFHFKMLKFMQDLQCMNKRQLFYRVLYFGMIISSPFILTKGLMVVTGSESPIVVVLSGSMEPAFYRGDILFLTKHREDPVQVGDVVVFKVEGRDIPIMHRVIRIHVKSNGAVKILTKGDNNPVDDRELYPYGQIWLEELDIIGKAKGSVPYVGIVLVLFIDYPKLKKVWSFGAFVGIVSMIFKEYPKLKYAALGCLGVYFAVCS